MSGDGEYQLTADLFAELLDLQERRASTLDKIKTAAESGDERLVSFAQHIEASGPEALDRLDAVMTAAAEGVIDPREVQQRVADASARGQQLADELTDLLVKRGVRELAGIQKGDMRRRRQLEERDRRLQAEIDAAHERDPSAKHQTLCKRVAADATLSGGLSYKQIKRCTEDPNRR